MENENFIPLVTLGLLKNPEVDDETCFPAAQTYSVLDSVNLTPEAVAGFLVSATECLIDTVPENQQIEFEKKTLRLFSKKVKIREQIMDQFANED